MDDSVVTPGPTPVLDGIRVVELAMFAFAPACTAVLADWGAEVVKVGHPGFADPMRGIPVAGLAPRADDVSFTWEQLNRNKRSIAIDVAAPDGREVLLDLVRDADVFVTNLLPDSRRRLGIDVDDLRAVAPNLVYVRASGTGPRGAEAGDPAFDHTAFWCRTGMGHAASLTADEFQPLFSPAMGDLTSGLALAGGVAAALFKRERTGEPSVVDGSLLATGMWVVSPGIVATQLHDIETLPRRRHADTGYALVAAYRTADDREVYLAGVRTDILWEELCDALGRRDLVDDPRFVDAAARTANNSALIGVLDEIFATRTLAEWEQRFAGGAFPWAVARTEAEVLRDPQARANDYLVPIDAQGRVPVELVASPVQFDELGARLRPAPEHGADTEAILLELGRSWDDIARLRDAGVL